MRDPASLPHRRCAGAMILNADGLVWIGKRRLGVDITGEGFAWQMPQGGIDKGEDPLTAARREVFEETGMTSLELIAEAPDWYAYDIPLEIVGAAGFRGKYRGQTQKWYAFRFNGDESEIRIDAPPDGSEVEFVDWRWEPMHNLPGLIVPFKRGVYESVVTAFAHLAVPR